MKILRKNEFLAIDLLKKLLFVFPQGRLSASKALAHKYFTENLVLEEKLQIPLNSEDSSLNLKMLQMNLNDYK